ncbi:MAG: SagB/ThcOx family dehydrogenase [Methanobacteriaceae archaeon]|nr:SagB/ThcOx family dehydrogenase [Methanobacteriaceae archaeon]
MKDSKDDYQKYRYFLKDSIRKTIDFSQTDQSRGVMAPPLEKPYSKDAEKIDLVMEDWETIYDISLVEAIKNRVSRRSFTKTEISLQDLSFLLWATQGIRQVAGPYAFRTVPSAGCRHALETYIAVFNVEELEMGVYRYLPLTHQLLVEFKQNDLRNEMITATFGQRFAGESALTFIWTAIPYRMEWRYGIDSHKVIAMDAGHVGQNMYLACEAIGAGTCTIGAYDQEYLDQLLKLDGEDEFAIYLAAAGKK